MRHDAERSAAPAMLQIDPQGAALDDAHRRLDALVSRCREANIFDVAWEETYWTLKPTGRASVAGDGGLWFTSDAATRSGAKRPFPLSYMHFAKAMVCRYQMGKHGGHSAGGLQQLISALRALWARIEKRGADPAILTNADFASAMKATKKRMGNGARNVGSRLAFIADEMDRHFLSIHRIAWKHAVTDNQKHDRIGPEADRRRKELMPSPEVLQALADISANATTVGHRYQLSDADLLVMRAVDLLVCGGFRINELLTVPRGCLIESDQLDDFGNNAVDSAGEPIKIVGIRYWPEKDGDTLVKDLASAVTDLARRAVADIDRITLPYSRVAKRQRQRPGRTILGLPWDAMPDDALLTTAELARAIGYGKAEWSKHLYSTAGGQFARNVGMVPVLGTGSGASSRAHRYRKSELEAHLAARSLSGDVHRRQEVKLLVEDCLFTVPLRLAHSFHQRGVNGTVTLLKDSAIYIFLAGQRGQPSIFERLGLTGNDGKILSATSHQFRHWLNTLAFEGKMSDAEVARWMGRRSLNQNAAYDHVSASEMARRVRDRICNGQATGPLVDAAARIRDPIERAALLDTHARSVISTPLGLCVHDWDALPCAKHGACGDCDEHWVVKGVNVGETIQQIADTEAALGKAEAVRDVGSVGADRSVEFHARTLRRLRQILAIHNDPRLPDGMLVQLRIDGTYSVPTNHEQSGDTDVEAI